MQHTTTANIGKDLPACFSLVPNGHLHIATVTCKCGKTHSMSMSDSKGGGFLPPEFYKKKMAALGWKITNSRAQCSSCLRKERVSTVTDKSKQFALRRAAFDELDAGQSVVATAKRTGLREGQVSEIRKFFFGDRKCQ